MKAALLYALAAPLALIPVFVSPAPATPAPQSAVIGTISEPVLIYDVTGGSFGGPIHVNMVVYNNGLISYASDESFFGGDIVSIQSAPEDVITKLTRKLERVGAFDLGDSFTPVSDLPRTTVTVLKGSTNSPSHSFSYNAASGPYGDVAQTISDFITANVDTLPTE